VIRAFELHMLTAIGYRPDLGRCGGCGRTVADLESVLIVPARGGAFCLPCRPRRDAAHPLAGPTAASLADLQQNPIGGADQPDQDAAAAEAALEELLAQVLTRPLRSRAVLAALRQHGSAC
jgi:DNA repair protein RecO (recombination protein O)